MKKIGLLLLSSLAFVACSSEDPAQSESEKPGTDGLMAVNITTRTDDIPAVQLQAGLFMVNYHDGKPGELLAANNYVNNQLLGWTTGGWTTITPIYWNDMSTSADFYAYAPYQASLTDARCMSFAVQSDQRTQEAFAQSDFLWGTVKGRSPSTQDFDLTLTHMLSQLTVVVTAEAGFDENELQAGDVAVTVGGSKTTCSVDLSTGLATPAGTATDVMCLSVGDLSYKAVLIPQQVPFSNLITVDWKGNLYTLQNSFLLEAGRQYTLTVKLKKTKGGFDIGIAGWDIIDEDFGGVIGG